uniref:Discs, large (Drosophila) homolog-associated protein 3 n=1 Tax=Scleropages formosus TaxID=113540 RepID=A0A8C9RA88_SCLFO
MKGYHVSRSLSQHSAGPCHCMAEDCELPHDYMPHPQDPRSAVDHYQGHNDHPYFPPGGPPEPLPLPHSGGGTFPRSYPSQQPYDSCDECLGSHGHMGKKNRIPPNLLDQFERQLPFHPDGFHTLQYQRAASGGQRSESPGRIRHLVHSVQRLFAKSHSLEAPPKREHDGPRAEARERGGGGSHRSGGEEAGVPRGTHHQSRSARRSKSRERSKSGDSRHGRHREHRHRSRTAGWWSSDDNLDSDSSFLAAAAGMGSRGGRVLGPPGPEALDGAIQDLTLKALKAKTPPGECVACTTMALAGDSGTSLKRSTWSTMTVNQAREVYPMPRGGGYDKALVPFESKLKERSHHYLQVPSEDWGGGYAGGSQDGEGEIPCRRMRSGSYIKAMGDDDSGESEPSPRASPKTALIAQREAFRRSVSMDHRSSGLARDHSLFLFQLGDALSRQFESVCESVFGEVESQAVEALDLPGCFRTRSHSYVRAIQAGCSQDDDCLSVFSMSMFPYRKMPPPLPPRIAKPLIAVTAQSSTESTQDSYFLSTGQPSPRPKPHSSSLDGLEAGSGRSSRTGYYPGMGGPRAKPHSGATGPGSEAEGRRGKWRPSIAVQTISDSDTESKALREVQSIGVQVEEDKRRARFKRSNSVTASVQADLEMEGFPGQGVPTQDKGLQFGCSFQRHSSEPESAGPYGEYRTVHTQGQWAYREEPQAPEPAGRVTSPRPPSRGGWHEGPRSLPDSGRASPCLRDGEFFLRLLQTEVERMEGWCQNMEREAEENDLPEQALELIRGAVGSAQLLMSQKVQQFFRMCQQSVDPTAYPQPTSQDLAGFWDLLQLAIEDVRVKFQDLQRLKDSGWRFPPDKKEEKKPPALLPKKPSVSGAPGESQRPETRGRLLQAKRAASFRQNSATESADSIEIYIPEAQTRL